MASDPCMFCGDQPCTCAGKKKSGLTRKPLSKKEPVEKPKAEVKPRPKPRPKPAPSKLSRERSIDPDLEQFLRTLDYLDMLHPDEKAKYAAHLKINPTTGKLVREDERGGEDGAGNAPGEH